MKTFALAIVLLAALGASAAAQDAPVHAGQAKAGLPAFKLQMVDPAIVKAVRATLDENPAPPLRHDGTVFSGDARKDFARQVDEAEVPSCWRQDALKHQPARIGPIDLGGLLALPFVAAAVVRGKCHG